MATPNYDINYDDSRFQKVESAKDAALNENEKTYNGMIDQSDSFYNKQIEASKDWADKQTQLQNEKTDFAIEQIEQQKSQARKDYLKEQSGAYVDWQKQSNEYGANAEAMAAQGLSKTGYSETSQVSMYNTYQNRVATARESYNNAVLNYNNAIKDARLQNNSALAEIAYNALQKQLELSLQGFQYKNQLLLDKAEKKLAIDSEYYSRYQDVLKQINTENALAEEVRQYNEQMAEEKRQFNETMSLQRDQLEEQKRQHNETMEYNRSKGSGSGSGSSGGGGSGEKIEKDEEENIDLPDATKNSLIKAGLAGRHPDYVAQLVDSGKLKATEKNGVTTFSKTGKNTKAEQAAKDKASKYKTGLFGATTWLKK